MKFNGDTIFYGMKISVVGDPLLIVATTRK
jgi:hypothetical protein